MRPKLLVALVVLALIFVLAGCGGVAGNNDNGGNGGNPPSPGGTPVGLQGVLMWKGDVSGKGLRSNETTLSPANVNPQRFGKLRQFAAHVLPGQHLLGNTIDSSSHLQPEEESL